MTIATIIVFTILGLVIAGSAIAMLLSRNAVYSALFLVLNFMGVGLLYLTLGAPFIALAQVTVYAGSIMVLFLFVIMLLGAEIIPEKTGAGSQRTIAALVGLGVLAELVVLILIRSDLSSVTVSSTTEFATPAALGILLFSKYLLPFEMTAAILLVATIGAIVLTHQEFAPRNKPPARQISEQKEGESHAH